jgi:outer membrane protein
MLDKCISKPWPQFGVLILVCMLCSSPVFAKPIPEVSAARAPLPALTIPSNDTLPPVNSSQSLTLGEVRDEALKTSPVLREYRSRKTEARFRVDEVYTQVAPTLGISANYTRLEPPLALSFGGLNFVAIAENNYDATLSLRQAIYTFGRLKWGAADAELQEKASKADLQYRQALVVENATVAFYQAGEASEQVRIAQQNYATRKAHLADAHAQVDAGISPAYDIKRDEAAFASAEQQLLAAQNRRSLTLVQLYLIMGIPQDGREPTQDILPLPQPPELLALGNVVAQREDLESVRWAYEAAKARVSLARTTDAPRLDFQTDYSRRNPITFSPAYEFDALIQLSLPIFDGGLTKAKVGQASAVVEQLSAQYDNAVRQVKLELDSYYLDLSTRWKTIDSAQRALDAAQEASRIATLRYQNGLSPNLETLDAESSLTQAEQDLATARFEYLVSLAHYRRAGGF